MGLRVMVVDDSPAMRGYVKRTLQMAGLALTTVLEAGDGVEALAAIERHYQGGNWLDLIFTDLNMPNLNGEGFVEKLRKSKEYSNIPVLVISTDSTQTRVLRLRSMGAQGYISKPCPPELIRTKLEQILGKTNV